MEWKLAEAKMKLSEVVRRALTEGPQRICRRDDAVIVLSEREYEQLTGARPDLKELLLGGPGLDGVDLERDASGPRDAGL